MRTWKLPGLKAARLAAGLTQVQLAEQAGVTQSHVSAVERGTRGVGVDVYLSLSDTLKGHVLTADSLGTLKRVLAEKLILSPSVAVRDWLGEPSEIPAKQLVEPVGKAPTHKTSKRRDRY